MCGSVTTTLHLNGFYSVLATYEYMPKYLLY